MFGAHHPVTSSTIEPDLQAKILVIVHAQSICLKTNQTHNRWENNNFKFWFLASANERKKRNKEIDRIKNNVNICCTIFRRYNRLENSYVRRRERDDTFLYTPSANNVHPKDKKIGIWRVYGYTKCLRQQHIHHRWWREITNRGRSQEKTSTVKIKQGDDRRRTRKHWLREEMTFCNIRYE